jgi:hypothetical protein
MPNPSVILWVDSVNNRLLSGWQSLNNAPLPAFKQGDNVGVEIHWVKAYNGAVMSEVPFPSGVSMTMAIGVVDKAPTSGSYTVSYGGVSTSAIAYNASVSDIQTALNALSTITAEGGVTIAEIGNLLRITWNTVGVRTNTFTVVSNDLFPDCSIGIQTVRAGSSGIKQVVQLHVKQSPVAMCNSFATQDPAAVTVSNVHTPGFTGDITVWRISISPAPRTGNFLLSWQDGSNTYTTAPIPCSATAAQMVTALNQADARNWNVITSGAYSWDISTPSSAVYNLTASGAGLVSFNSVYGVLNMNTPGVEDLLNGSSTTQATLEIKLNASGTTTTLIQTTCEVDNDIIDNDAYTLITYGDVIPADAVLRFDTAQTLTSGQKTQARTNIGAISQDDATATITTKDVELQGRIVALEALEISANEKAALDGALSPSSSNVFITTSALSAATSGFLTTSSAIPQSQITGLSTTLSGFATTTQMWPISSITGLSTQLATYATTASLANISSTTIGTLTVSSALILPSSSIQANSQSGSFTNGIYTNEIIISVNGTNYAIPCRPA